MSRNISIAAAGALLTGANWQQSNTRVEGGSMYLHENEIAWNFVICQALGKILACLGCAVFIGVKMRSLS